jgi:hypothetical protein
MEKIIRRKRAEGIKFRVRSIEKLAQQLRRENTIE